MAHIGFYYNKNNPQDVNLIQALNRISERETRTFSETIRFFLWDCVKGYDSHHTVLDKRSILKTNPLARIPVKRSRTSR